MAKRKKAAPAKRYAYRTGSFGVPAQVAGEELSRIEQEYGCVRPKDVVNESREEEAPLHPAFEWDDEIAGELYRCDQAGRLLRCTYVVGESEEGKRAVTPAYLSVVVPEDGERGYVSTPRVMADDQMREFALKDVMAQLRGLANRNRHLHELAGVWEAIEAAASVPA
jgi:hypothetical protein